jgi:hypothetical protein
MDNKDVPYIVHEGDMARMERTIKRLWITNIILILLFVGSNVAWLMYESQFTDEKTTYEQEVEQDSSDGGNNQFIGGDYNGKAESEN